MKKFIYLGMMMVLGLAFVKPANAQVRININIGSQPVWGPVGYDYASYYYFPDIEAYYNIPTKQFIYREGRHWVKMDRLPNRYRNFDVYGSYKVVINDRDPYLRHDAYRTRYATYKGRHGQEIIRDSRDKRYYAVNGHRDNDNRWDNNRNNRNDHRDDRNDRDRGNGRGRH